MAEPHDSPVDVRTAEDAKWWVAPGNDETGPMSEAAVLAMIKSGQVARGTPAWAEDEEDWRPIEHWPQFARHFPPQRPWAPERKAAFKSNKEVTTESSAIRLLVIYILSIGGAAFAAISAWLCGWLLSVGVFVGSGFVASATAWILVGLGISVAIVVASCWHTYAVMNAWTIELSERNWLSLSFSEPIIGILRIHDKRWRQLVLSLVALPFGLLFAWAGFVGFGLVYIGAVLVSLLALLVTAALLFTRKDGVSQLRMAGRFLAKGEREAGLVWLDAAIAQNPRLGRAYYERACANQTDLVFYPAKDSVLKDLDKAIEFDPGIADAYRMRAESRQFQGLLDEALEDFDRSIRLDPANTRLHKSRTRLLQRKSEWQLAIESATSWIELAPDDLLAFHMRGELSMEAGNFEAAYQTFPPRSFCCGKRATTRRVTHTFSAVMHQLPWEILTKRSAITRWHNPWAQNVVG